MLFQNDKKQLYNKQAYRGGGIQEDSAHLGKIKRILGAQPPPLSICWAGKVFRWEIPYLYKPNVRPLPAYARLSLGNYKPLKKFSSCALQYIRLYTKRENFVQRLVVA